MPIKGCVCVSHRKTSKFDHLGYVEKALEAERRIKVGWKQRPCKYCGALIWIDPTQVRGEAKVQKRVDDLEEARKRALYFRDKCGEG